MSDKYDVLDAFEQVKTPLRALADAMTTAVQKAWRQIEPSVHTWLAEYERQAAEGRTEIPQETCDLYEKLKAVIER